MKRRLLNILAAVSLVLLAGTCLLWVRSHSRIDLLGRWTISTDQDETTIHQCCGVLSSRGTIAIGSGTYWATKEAYNSNVVVPAPQHRVGWSYWSVTEWVAPTWLYFWIDDVDNLLGFRIDYRFYKERDTPIDMNRWVIYFPHWFVVLLATLMPGKWLLNVMARQLALRRLRRGRGFCRICGYNLTGNVSGVCPECGTAILPSARNSASDPIARNPIRS